MGVAGCGKSTVAEALARRIGADYVDGDSLHPKANIDKMAGGHPLSDSDRGPWLEAVGAVLRKDGTVVACSALKRAYRDIICRSAGRSDPVTFLYLRGDRELLKARMEARTRHFMPVSLLDSQLETLEEPGPDENAVAIDIHRTVPDIVKTFLEAIGPLSARDQSARIQAPGAASA
ncbi:gluconokinase [Fulvimarina endophytica]|uniref:Gluconokinase n=2 Tax=Fulvimarina endophytica TaxID=2293836 RepID=A0A371X3H1_9HYPH|nr:gluconokinase [Fulvimarina endophytica]